MMKEGALLIGYCFDADNGDTDVLIVSRRTFTNETEIVNAFQGKEAHEIYSKLTTVRKK